MLVAVAALVTLAIASLRFGVDSRCLGDLGGRGQRI